MRSHDSKMTLGKRHIEMIVNGKYSDMIVRTITKVKSGNNGFERYYATIDHKRVEVFLNPKGVTGAAFRSEAEYTINLGDENGVVKDNDEKVWWNKEKQDWETIDEAVARQSNVDLDDDCDGDLEAMENDLIAMNNEEKDAEKIVIERSDSEGKFRVSIYSGFLSKEVIRDFLPTQEMAIQCAQFASVKEGIDIIENQAAKDDEFEQWFHDNAHRMEFHCITTFCSYCNKDVTHVAYYVGITNAGIPFEFCKQCRDMLQQRKAAETSQLECTVV